MAGAVRHAVWMTDIASIYISAFPPLFDPAQIGKQLRNDVLDAAVEVNGGRRTIVDGRGPIRLRALPLPLPQRLQTEHALNFPPSPP